MCKVVLGLLAVIGVISLLLGIILGTTLFYDLIYQGAIDNRVLTIGSPQVERWQNPFPHYLKVYFFNVTNPEEILAGERPVVNEVGPFIYNVTLTREARFTLNGDKIDYTQYRNYTFDVNSTYPLGADTRITVLNYPLQSLLELLDQTPTPELGNDVLTMAFPDTIDSIFHTINASEYVFDGYVFCRPEDITGEDRNAELARGFCERARMRADDTAYWLFKPADEANTTTSFSFFDFKHLKQSTNYVIKTGIHNYSELGSIVSWDDRRYWDTWPGGNSTCNRIRGRDYFYYPPHISRETSFDIFYPDICSVVNWEFEKKSAYQNIDSYRYRQRNDTFADASTSEDHACYCINRTRNLDGERDCLPTGFRDMESCMGLPLILSNPHLLGADSSYAQTVEGLTPNMREHTPYFNIEPMTGAPLYGSKMLQYNLFIRSITNITLTKNITSSVLPIIWFEEGLEMPQRFVHRVHREFYQSIIKLDVTMWSLIAAGIVLLFIGIIGLICCR